MRNAAILVVISSSLLVAACAYRRPPVVYTTPNGQVISAAADARTAADRALETSLRAELNQYGDLATVNRDLRIYARNGAVTLTGPVRSERDRQMIATLARNTPGVLSVNDQIQVVYPPTGAVTPSSPAPVYVPPVTSTPASLPRIEAAGVADEVLARHIGDQLRTEPLPVGWMDNVTIRVSNGAAYVQGYVATQQQREAIDAAIQRVRGVTAVYDQMQVR